MDTYILLLEFHLANVHRVQSAFSKYSTHSPPTTQKIQLLYNELLSCYMQPTYIRNTSLSMIDPEDKQFMLPLHALYLGVREMIKPEILSK